MASRTSSMTVSEMRRALDNARGRLGAVKKKATAVAGQALQTVEIGGSAFALSYLRGRMANEQGDWKVVGVDPELLAAVGFHGLAFVGAFGQYSEHMHNVGDGALAAFLAGKGLDFGVQAKQNAGTSGMVGTAGIPRAMPAPGPRFQTAFDHIGQPVSV